jgi:hypothetical protein
MHRQAGRFTCLQPENLAPKPVVSSSFMHKSQFDLTLNALVLFFKKLADDLRRVENFYRTNLQPT